MRIRTYTFLSVGASLSAALALAAAVVVANRSANTLSLAAAGALVAVIAICGVALYTNMKKRLRGLAGAAQAVAAGDLSVRISDTSSDELGALGATFNHMASKLQETVNTLEDMVAQRTADMSETEEKLRLLIEGLKEYAVCTLDSSGLIVSWNTGAELISGYTEHEAIGQHVSMLYTGEDVEGAKVEWAMEMAAETGRFEEERWSVRKDGTQFWAETIVSAVRDGTGELRGFAKVTRDITERNRIQQENRLLLDTTRAVSAARDYDDALTKAIHSICETVGWALGQAWERNDEGVLECGLGWHDGSEAVAALYKASGEFKFAPGKGLPGRVWVSQKPEWIEDVWAGEATIFERRELTAEAGLRSVYAVPVVDDGDTLAVLEFFSDGRAPRVRQLTEVVASVVQQLGSVIRRKQAEDEVRQLNESLEARVLDRTQALERSNRELDDFTYVVSHDLKEPLRGIEGYSAFLMEDYAAQIDDEGKRYLTNIREGAVRMKELIEDLLDLSKIGRTQEQRAPVSTAEMLAGVRSDLQFSIAEKGIDLRIQMDMPTVEAEKVALREVFRNLISNAVKFSDKTAGVVEVGCEQQNGAAQFFVRDNGIGIDERYHDKIFQIFQRLNRHEEYEGTGVGLTICKKVIESHGGRIWVESQLDQGSTFYFTIPTAAVESGKETAIAHSH